MKIIIPTYKREGKQKAYENIPERLKVLVTLVTHSGRAEALRANYPDANIDDLGETDGIADVRAKIVRRYGQEDEKVMFIDDGCVFKKRNDEMKLVPMEEEDYVRMFRLVSENLDHYPMVGISDQAGNNRITDEVSEIGRSYSCYGVNANTFAEAGVNFDDMYRENSEIKLYEDFYILLKLLTMGYKNAIIYSYAFSHSHGKEGGNSEIRTNSLQKRCLEALQFRFPEFVKLVKKRDPSWKAGLDDKEDFRWEAVIKWKAAYESSKQLSDSLEGFF